MSTVLQLDKVMSRFVDNANSLKFVFEFQMALNCSHSGSKDKTNQNQRSLWKFHSLFGDS